MLRRSRADSQLHHELSKFLRANNYKGSAYVEARLASYKAVNRLALLAKDSTVGSTLGVSSIYYARIFTSFNLIKIFSCADAINLTIGETLKTTIATKFETLHPSFEEVVEDTVQDPSAASSFLALERMVHDKVEFGDTSGVDWRGEFSASNRQTECYTRVSIELDLVALTTLRDRIWNNLT